MYYYICIWSSHACWDVWALLNIDNIPILPYQYCTLMKKQLEYTVKDSILRLTMVKVLWCLPTRHIIFAPKFVSEKLWSTMVRWLECRSLDLSSCWMFISKAMKWTSVYLKCQVGIGRWQTTTTTTTTTNKQQVCGTQLCLTVWPSDSIIRSPLQERRTIALEVKDH